MQYSTFPQCFRKSIILSTSYSISLSSISSTRSNIDRVWNSFRSTVWITECRWFLLERLSLYECHEIALVTIYRPIYFLLSALVPSLMQRFLLSTNILLPTVYSHDFSMDNLLVQLLIYLKVLYIWLWTNIIGSNHSSPARDLTWLLLT